MLHVLEKRTTRCAFMQAPNASEPLREERRTLCHSNRRLAGLIAFDPRTKLVQRRRLDSNRAPALEGV